MNHRKALLVTVITILSIVTAGLLVGPHRWLPAQTRALAADPQQDNPDPPADTVKLVFIHHSCGEHWLDAGNGNLGDELGANNYYVSDTDYGWGPDGIGSFTDIGHWWTWFRSPNSPTYTQALYDTTNQDAIYTRPMPDPAGENTIVMFKSCFPNSNLKGDPAEPPPPIGCNPLRGQKYDSAHHTVANAKGIYIDLLNYFQTRQDKLFIAITAPPVMDPTWADNARAFNDWLVNDWLASYPYDNVAVWDFYNVLTSNGGNWYTNDLGWETGNHHRWRNGAEQHQQTVPNNTAAYPDGGGDNHPSAAGNQKATGEYVELLNVYYHRWVQDQGTPTPSATGEPATATPTRTPGTPPAPDHWVHLPVVPKSWAGAPPTGTPQTTPTNTAQPAPTATPQPGQQVIVFQQGVSPDPGYDGASDTIVASDFYTVNMGALNYVESFFGEGAEIRRSLLRWEISALPAGADVHAATVELHRHDGYSENDMAVALYRLTRGWTEGTGVTWWPGPGYTADGATWNEAGPGIPWTDPGGDYDPTAVGQTTIPAGTGDRWFHWDATAAVEAWVEQGQPNYGLLLRPLSGDYSYHYYHSGEAQDDAVPLHPRLVITYTDGGGARAGGPVVETQCFWARWAARLAGQLLPSTDPGPRAGPPPAGLAQRPPPGGTDLAHLGRGPHR